MLSCEALSTESSPPTPYALLFTIFSRHFSPAYRKTIVDPDAPPRFLVSRFLFLFRLMKVPMVVSPERSYHSYRLPDLPVRTFPAPANRALRLVSQPPPPLNSTTHPLPRKTCKRVFFRSFSFLSKLPVFLFFRDKVFKSSSSRMSSSVFFSMW